MFSLIIDPKKLVDVPWMQQEVEAIGRRAIEEGKKHAQNFTDDKIAERLMNLYQNI